MDSNGDFLYLFRFLFHSIDISASVFGIHVIRNSSLSLNRIGIIIW